MRITTGQQSGRTVRILANTPSALLADITDGSTQSTPLNLSGFALKPNDGFSIFPGYTLTTLLGDGSSQNPLLIVGGSTPLTADTVSLYDSVARKWLPYYYNSLRGKWERPSSIANCNHTPIFPGSAISISRRQNRSASSFVMIGEVPSLAVRIKAKGGTGAVSYTHLTLPTICSV